jgi:Xaa-Pro dipeptidase
MELDYFRAVKTPYEIKCIEYANQIAARGHLAAQHAAELEVSEFHLNHVYCEATRQRETELPYPNIIALNEHASVLHYQHLDHVRPPQVHSFLLDAGAQFNGYASDITRTRSLGNSGLQALIDAVDSMQQSLCSQARNGKDFVELNDQAHRLVAEILHEQRFVTASAAQAYDSGITRTFLPHGLGHLLGLQVHDVGGHQIAPDGTLRPPPSDHPYLRLTRVLEPGFVLTIEPGIYFIPMLLRELAASTNAQHVNWDLVKEFIPFGGVRIEDDVAVTATGARNLTRQFLSSG